MPNGIPSTVQPFIRVKYPERLDGAKGYGTNYIRRKIFNDAAKRMKPDASVVNKYKQFLVDNFVQALKEQLPASQRKSLGYVAGRQQRKTIQDAGVATGRLRRTIEATCRVIIGIDASKGRYDIDFYLTPNFEFWGGYIANGRRAGYIPIDVLITWIERKMSNGVLTMDDKKNWTVKGFAIAISRAANKRAKPPVVKDWYLMSKNSNLERRFKKYIRAGGTYYRTLIKNNIIKKMNIQYGNIK
jgi:hypothetical protein